MMTRNTVKAVVNAGLAAAKPTRTRKAPKGKEWTATSADEQRDADDARMEAWLESRGQHEAAGRVYANRLARAVVRGSIAPTATIEEFCWDLAGVDLAGEAIDAAIASRLIVVDEQPALRAFQAAWTVAIAEATEAARVTQNIETLPAEAVTVPTPTEVVAPTVPLIYDGTFTVESPKGGHRTFKIRTQRDGSRYIALLTGPDNVNSYERFGFINNSQPVLKVWPPVFRETTTAKGGAMLVSLLLGDDLGRKLTEAGYKVHESRRCFRCGRKLTHPESCTSGYGPECVNHV